MVVFQQQFEFRKFFLYDYKFDVKSQIFLCKLVKTKEMRQCLHCSNKVIGRTDKKFCSAGCRSTYHNELRNGKALERYQLMLNRQLLRFMRTSSSQKEPTLALGALKSLGFNPDVCTSQREYQGVLYQYCFEMAYAVKENKLILLD